jgi:glyoxylase-like metal-dependent hydrolase (beta-lactamase superfamily II)
MGTPRTAAWAAFLGLALAAAGCAAPEVRVSTWQPVGEGVWRSPGTPAAYALIEGDSALLIGAAAGADPAELRFAGASKIDLVLLTHHHRHSLHRAAAFLEAGVPVRAPRASIAWISADGVRAAWARAVPVPEAGRTYGLRDRSFDVWNYHLLPEGLPKVDCTIDDGTEIDWRGWTLKAYAAPGHSRDHTAYAARRKDSEGPALLFCGDAMAEPGRMWAPYTTDWDHWTDEGLQAAATSLRRLAALKPARVFPEHGPALSSAPEAALLATAQNAEEAGFLKSYERFTKLRVRNAPAPRPLEKTQVATAGQLPFSRLSDHLFLSGNTYVVASRRGPTLVVDPFGPDLSPRLRKLELDRFIGPVEVVLVSHAHNDHYVGVHDLPHRDWFQVWTLDQVATPIGSPQYFMAPYLDPRPLATDRVLKDGQILGWREYALKIHHLPGQTAHAVGIETVIDGRKCFFTGDNFFVPDQFSGSGGWSGRNRGLPGGYAASARAVLAARPSWVLASHGGAFEFMEEDWKRRVQWAEAAAAAADRLSPTGRHLLDWDPHRIRVEPFVTRAMPDRSLTLDLVLSNPRERAATFTLELDGRGLLDGFRRTVTLAPGATLRQGVDVRLREDVPAGRHVFPVRVAEGEVEDGTDLCFIVDIPAR